MGKLSTRSDGTMLGGTMRAAPPFPPHFPVRAPFPAGRVLHVGVGAEVGGLLGARPPARLPARRPSDGCLLVRFSPNRHRAIQLRPDPAVCLSKQSSPIWISPPSSLPPSLSPFSSCGLATQPVHILLRCTTREGRRSPLASRFLPTRVPCPRSPPVISARTRCF